MNPSFHAYSFPTGAKCDTLTLVEDLNFHFYVPTYLCTYVTTYLCTYVVHSANKQKSKPKSQSTFFNDKDISHNSKEQKSKIFRSLSACILSSFKLKLVAGHLYINCLFQFRSFLFSSRSFENKVKEVALLTQICYDNIDLILLLLGLTLKRKSRLQPLRGENPAGFCIFNKAKLLRLLKTSTFTYKSPLSSS